MSRERRLDGPRPAARVAQPVDASRLRNFGSRLLVGLILVGFVVLVTVVFSFAGTIMSCVMLGMMMGSLRSSVGTAVPVSALFPIVTVALLQYPIPAVSLSRALALAALCFAVFWVMYASTRAMMFLESGGKSSSTQRARNLEASVEHNSPEVSGGSAAETTSPLPTAAALPLNMQCPADAALGQLQGRWIRQPLAGVGNHAAAGEAIEIHQRTFLIHRKDAAGCLQACTAGSVTCEMLGPFRTLHLSSLKALGPGDPGLASGATDQTWIYRLHTEMLTIASQFGDDSSLPPMVGVYRKAGADG